VRERPGGRADSSSPTGPALILRLPRGGRAPAAARWESRIDPARTPEPGATLQSAAPHASPVIPGEDVAAGFRRDVEDLHDADPDLHLADRLEEAARRFVP